MKNVSAIDLYTSNRYLALGNIKGYYGPGKDAYYMEKGLGHTQFSLPIFWVDIGRPMLQAHEFIHRLLT